MSIPVGVVGATGYTGGELVRLLAGHPGFELAYVSASERSRAQLGAVHPHLRGGEAEELVLPRLVPTRASEAARACRAVFLATPAAVSARLAPILLEHGVELVVDLSPAYRLRARDAHEQWYPDVPWHDRDGVVYGLPELHRDELPAARVIAAPGCLATAAILALLPLTALTGVRITGIAIDGKTGSTGGGASPKPAGQHAVRAGVVAPYAPVRHRHTAEISQELIGRGLATAGGGLRLGMSVFGVDLVRGVAIAAHAFAEPDSSPELSIEQACRETFAKQRFVRVRDWRGEAVPLPDPKALTGSNYCDIAAFHDQVANRYVLLAALDNLMKGAAGQAVQAANIRYDLPEDLGVSALPLYPA